ncbi:hypothetical protein BG011_005846 [Mortierella polycephala]|uniref:Eukaryotic mitochondrial regulator protein-domain-containing protein n=1 Tax=Mortierella polycephala TaxID=41804 RepID=A0A9P6QBI1_9FUNG|nr:hypothetical protein BG011_005846 [Mortierella polycephala]
MASLSLATRALWSIKAVKAPFTGAAAAVSSQRFLIHTSSSAFDETKEPEVPEAAAVDGDASEETEMPIGKKLPNRRRNFNLWLQGEGVRFEKPSFSGPNYISDVPFPMNPLFKPTPPISNIVKDEIYKQHITDNTKWTPRQLGMKYNISIKRVEAILRLKHLEKEMVEDGFILQENLTKGMEQLMGVKPERSAAITEPLTDILPQVGSPKFEAVDEEKEFTAVDAADVLKRRPLAEIKARMLEMEQQHPFKLVDSVKGLAKISPPQTRAISRNAAETSPRFKFTFMDTSKNAEPGDCPPASALRHHRRSVDRIWPPALEVKLARLSIDEGSVTNPYIIPAPPPVAFENQEHCQDGRAPETLGTIQEADGTPDEAEAAVGTGSTTPLALPSLLSRRHSSGFDPLSHPTHFQLDELHQQHIHPPKINVQYHKRCRSMSLIGVDMTGGATNAGSAGNIGGAGNSNSNKEHNVNKGLRTRHMSLVVPALHKPAFNSPIPTDINEYGEDLFRRNNLDTRDSLASDSSILEFQQQVLQRGAGDLPQIRMPQLVKPHPYRHSELLNNPDTNMSGPDVALLDLPPPHLHQRSSFSPMSRNPLSAASTPVSTPPRSPITRNRSPLSRIRTPLHESGFNVQSNTRQYQQQQYQQQTYQPNLLVGNKKRMLQTNNKSQLPLGVRTQGTNNQENKQNGQAYDESLHKGLPMSFDMIPKDPWKSPTLSALASQSSSRAHSPRPMSPMALSNTQYTSRHRKRRPIPQLEEGIDITLIETHDEIPLQDIWRMEDEERKNRLKGANEDISTTTLNSTTHASIEDHITNMKGEHHAHEDAPLIQDALHAPSLVVKDVQISK